MLDPQGRVGKPHIIGTDGGIQINDMTHPMWIFVKYS